MDKNAQQSTWPLYVVMASQKTNTRTSPTYCSEKTEHSKTHCMIYYSEVVIVRPKSLLPQAATQSDYNQPQRFLICNRNMTNWIHYLLSECYGGRACGNFLSNSSGYYDFLQHGNKVIKAENLLFSVLYTSTKILQINGNKCC